jgi:hypothetical protein
MPVSVFSLFQNTDFVDFMKKKIQTQRNTELDPGISSVQLKLF